MRPCRRGRGRMAMAMNAWVTPMNDRGATEGERGGQMSIERSRRHIHSSGIRHGNIHSDDVVRAWFMVHAWVAPAVSFAGSHRLMVPSVMPPASSPSGKLDPYLAMPDHAREQKRLCTFTWSTRAGVRRGCSVSVVACMCTCVGVRRRLAVWDGRSYRACHGALHASIAQVQVVELKQAHAAVRFRQAPMRVDVGCTGTHL